MRIVRDDVARAAADAVVDSACGEARDGIEWMKISFPMDKMNKCARVGV